jgi:malonyl-CoA/methylmalonyl-CoA synthetase
MNLYISEMEKVNVIETLSSLIDQTALRLGQKEAILFLRKGSRESRVTYLSLKKISDQVASGLKEMGLEKGDRVIVFMPKSVEAVMIHLAVLKTGGISVILNPGFKRDEVAYFLRDTDAKIIVVGKKEEGVVRTLAPGRLVLSVDTESPFSEEKLFPRSLPWTSSFGGNLHDPAVLIYTSGTTGQPKGAILTQQNLIQDVRNIIRIWEITEKDALCHALPLFHIHGLCFALHTSFTAGCKMVMLDEFSSEHVNDILSQQEGELACTIFMGVPTMYVKMMGGLRKEPRDFSHLRLLASGSAPLPPREFDRIKRIFGKEPVEREGMSETGMNFSNPLKGRKKPGSIGLPLPGVEARIVDPDSFKDLGTGEVGEIWLRGPNVTPGYWGKPRETEAAFINGWFRTGDLGKKDEEGYYSITDRLKHIIISGGENISPKEVESVLDRHPGISESCVVGVPDEKWGEKVVAGIVLKPGFMPAIDEIKRFCKEYLSDWKCPKEFVFLKELPRNRMGKIMKEDVVREFVESSRHEG